MIKEQKDAELISKFPIGHEFSIDVTVMDENAIISLRKLMLNKNNLEGVTIDKINFGKCINEDNLIKWLTDKINELEL